VLEASYIVTLLRPHHRNFGKRLVKTPKLYFLDAGLAAWLLGIRSTVASDWMDGLKKWQKLAQSEAQPPCIVHGGQGAYEREGIQITGWQDIAGLPLG